jgi:hypothetical protein
MYGGAIILQGLRLEGRIGSLRYAVFLIAVSQTSAILHVVTSALLECIWPTAAAFGFEACTVGLPLLALPGSVAFGMFSYPALGARCFELLLMQLACGSEASCVFSNVCGAVSGLLFGKLIGGL